MKFQLFLLKTFSRPRNLKEAKNCSIAGGVRPLKDISAQCLNTVTSILGNGGELKMGARVVLGCHVFFSKLYTRVEKRNACVVQFKDNTFGEIELFAWNDNKEVIAVYKQISIDMGRPFFFDDAGHHVLCVNKTR